MKIHELALLSGVSVRTLQYYDRIGLFKPDEITQAGYRLYSEKSLPLLQEILFLKELDFPLSEIKKIVSGGDGARSDMLEKQLRLLELKRSRLDGIIELARKSLKGDKEMSFNEFSEKEYNEMKKKYASEVRERWGNTPQYEESVSREQKLSAEDTLALGEGAREIFAEFAALRQLSPASPEAASTVKKWQDYITASFYTCTDEILLCLGEIYTGDERFKSSLDAFGEGTALFMSEAIKAYCGTK